MGYRITDNYIYGMDPSGARLRKIGSDGIAVDLGIPKDIPPAPIYYAGDVTPDGKYLLLIGLGGPTAQIVKIDLEDPAFQCTFVPIKVNNLGIVDIAFDPFTGILYGHDFVNRKLVIIDPDSGNVNLNFTQQPQVDQLGALFFDSFGNLFGYGSYGSLVQDKFVSINKQTGEITLLAKGPVSAGQDGCSCPYTMELQKLVSPEIAYPCTEVIYSFIISNGSGAVRNNIILSDTMPEGLTIKSILYNPYGGIGDWNSNILTISNMSVRPGIDTIKVVVEVGPEAIGLYRNQAKITGLPPALGSTTYSDNPFTFLEKDSTDLWINSIDLSFIDTLFTTCPGDSVFVDATIYGLKYLWQDGDNSPFKWLKSPGIYQLNVRSLCEEKNIEIVVKDDIISLNIIMDTFFINLGEEINLISEFKSSIGEVSFLWTSVGNKDVNCITCQNTDTTPLNDGEYILSLSSSDGCIVTDRVIVRVNKDRRTFTPNIISLGENQGNNIFFISGNDKVAKGMFMKIYDRWGNKVFDFLEFDLNQPEHGWDGTFKGKAVVNGVYTWVAGIKYIDGFSHQISGDITVLK